MRLIHIVGARPNFMKAAPVMRALDAVDGVEQVLVHTGQHYDRQMSDVFFEQLGLCLPDHCLGIGSGSDVQQLAKTMLELEPLFAECPDMLVVYGDVNSTLAAALVAAKMNVRIAHVEAGLRSFDLSMPEEVNRILVDRLSHILLASSADGVKHLADEGIVDNVHFVGNVMIDTLQRLLPLAEQRADEMALPVKYALVTLHRPSNVDDREVLTRWLTAITDLSQRIKVFFPMHPRTIANVRKFGLEKYVSSLTVLPPQGYVDFLAMTSRATMVVTDSGGIQEETSHLGVPCLTLRENTERPVTIEKGTNVLIGMDVELLHAECAKVLSGEVNPGGAIPLWDGCAGERIADIICQKVY